MGKKHKASEERLDEQLEPDQSAAAPADDATEEEAAATATETAAVEGEPDLAEAAPESEEMARLSEEFKELNDRYLRMAAEFDNFRKRVARDRAVDGERAKADLLRNILEGLDDLGRIAHLDLTAATVDDVATGVQMVERKLLDELATTGLERITGDGEVFDPNLHEAVGSLPAPDHEQDGQVAQVLQVGYRFGRTLLRPARVLVFMARDDEDEEE
jgi:molecular chaperone GrpE